MRRSFSSQRREEAAHAAVLLTAASAPPRAPLVEPAAYSSTRFIPHAHLCQFHLRRKLARQLALRVITWLRIAKVLPGAFIPTEFLDSSEPVLAEPLSKRWVVRDQPYIFRDVARVIGIAIERGIATDLAQRRNSRRHNGTAVSHCLQRGESQSPRRTRGTADKPHCGKGRLVRRMCLHGLRTELSRRHRGSP